MHASIEGCGLLAEVLVGVVTHVLISILGSSKPDPEARITTRSLVVSRDEKLGSQNWDMSTKTQLVEVVAQAATMVSPLAAACIWSIYYVFDSQISIKNFPSKGVSSRRTPMASIIIHTLIDDQVAF